MPVKTSVEDHMKSHRLLGLPGITAVCLLLSFASLTPSPLAAQDSRSSIKNFQHVFIIMMENTGFDTLIGNPNAPFINAAAANFGLISLPVLTKRTTSLMIHAFHSLHPLHQVTFCPQLKCLQLGLTRKARNQS